MSDGPFVPFLERLALLLMGDLLKTLGSVAAFLAHDILIRPTFLSTSSGTDGRCVLPWKVRHWQIAPWVARLQRVVHVGVSSWTIPLLGYPILAHTQMVGLPATFERLLGQFLPIPTTS